jgi:hypothetical protein
MILKILAKDQISLAVKTLEILLKDLLYNIIKGINFPCGKPYNIIE